MVALNRGKPGWFNRRSTLRLSAPRSILSPVEISKSVSGQKIIDVSGIVIIDSHHEYHQRPIYGDSYEHQFLIAGGRHLHRLKIIAMYYYTRPECRSLWSNKLQKDVLRCLDIFMLSC